MLGERRWRVWSCDAHLLVTDPALAAEAEAIASACLTAIGDACDRFRSDSELERLPAGIPTAVSPILHRLVRTALEVAERTDGLCDPTVGDAVRAAGYDRDIRLVLDDDRPVRVVVRPRRRWDAVRLDGDVLTVPSGMQLDLGATAKALAADLVVDRIAAELGGDALMNLGGDIATAGEPEDGWQVLVQDVPGDPAAHIALHGGYALATSSTQRRTWRRGGEQLHHIVDPRTGAPAQRVWRTVSVVAPTAVQANGETTAAIVAGDAAPDRLEALGLPARLVALDGSVRLLNGWPAEAREAA